MKTVLLILVAGLVGCATLRTVLMNDATGDITECGGDRSLSHRYGTLGYDIQKATDQRCIKGLEAEGYRQIGQVVSP